VAGFDARRRLASVRCPVLVVAGDRDATVPLAAKRRVQEAIPGARLLVVADSGHATPCDQAGRFNAALLAFVESH
jgi:pimeloyl-ACP methyl ester carboxylesterase